ncbi:MAG TPA: hypothetical protein DEG90_01055 [Porphyromonadaceae bacterium]|nr:hypothetical protein [Porphyromonadaceae bacterium]
MLQQLQALFVQLIKQALSLFKALKVYFYGKDIFMFLHFLHWKVKREEQQRKESEIIPKRNEKSKREST